MVRLNDLADYERAHLLAKNLPPLGPPAWVPPTKEIAELRIALITTAGLHFRDDPSFEFADATFRPISGSEDANNLVMSHSSVNFDKVGFAEDVNLVSPSTASASLRLTGRSARWRTFTTVLWVQV